MKESLSFEHREASFDLDSKHKQTRFYHDKKALFGYLKPQYALDNTPGGSFCNKTRSVGV